jgi:hypothetical protein
MIALLERDLLMSMRRLGMVICSRVGDSNVQNQCVLRRGAQEPNASDNQSDEELNWRPHGRLD